MLLLALLPQHQASFVRPASLPGVSTAHALSPVGLLFPIYSEVTFRSHRGLLFLLGWLAGPQHTICCVSMSVVKLSFSAHDPSW